MLITFHILGRRKISGHRGGTLLRSGMFIVIANGLKMRRGEHGPSQNID